MASSAKDIQLRELKDTVSQRKTMIAEQTELIKALRLIIDEKTSHEKALQEQVDYLTKKLFGPSSERRSDVSAKYCYAAHESRLHQNDRCKRFALCLVLTVRFRSLAPWGKLFQLFI